MTGNPIGKLRRKSIFDGDHGVPDAVPDARREPEYPRKFSRFASEAGLFLKKAF
jgi:hypothetical protein